MSRMSRAIVVWCGALLAWGGFIQVQAARPAADDLLPVASHAMRVPAGRVLQAQSSSPAAAPADLDHGAVFKKYCVTCHNEKLKTGGLLLDKMNVGDLSADGEKWEKIVRKLRSRAMPPAGMPRPDDATYDAVATRLETDLDRLAASNRNPGRVSPFHRLTRTEYRNAIRDLLSLNDLPKGMDLEVLLPADNSSTGFDNLADLLFVSSTQLEQYLSAAQ